MANKTILVAPSFAPGHTFPHLAIAAALVKHGHRVIFHAEVGMRSLAEQAGCEWWKSPVGNAPLRFARVRSTAGLVNIYGRLAREVVSDLSTRLRRCSLDAVVTDALHLGAALVAERSGVPWTTLATTPAALSPTAANAAQALLPTRRLRSTLGLPPDFRSSLEQGFSPHRILLPWTPEFEGGRPPHHAVYVGPLSNAGAHRSAPSW